MRGFADPEALVGDLTGWPWEGFGKHGLASVSANWSRYVSWARRLVVPRSMHRSGIGSEERHARPEIEFGGELTRLLDDLVPDSSHFLERPSHGIG
jgi:hypothetical protein